MVKIFVGNLNPISKAADLKKRFELYGKVTECDVVNNYAFVHMDSESDAEAAIAKLHNSEFDSVKINVEMSHGKRTNGGGPMRRRMNERRARAYREERLSGPPRLYFGNMDGPGRALPYPNMRDSRFGPPSWEDNYPPMYGSRNPPRDYPSNGTPGRYSDREPSRPRVAMRESPFSSGYRGVSGVEPVPPPRDYPRKSSPPRGRYENYEPYGDYERYREPGPPHMNAPQPQRSNDYYDNYGNNNYGSYSGGGGGGGYDIPNREFRENDRGGNYESSYDCNYYDGPGNRSPLPPRNNSGYNYGRP